MKKHLLICVTFFYVLLTQAQVTVDINSGNPRFPFPQFLAYTSDGGHHLENLGTVNEPGLTHAEMERRTREAWQIMSNRFEYTGQVHQGVQYIKSNIGCPYDCTEGVGYAMIGAALLGDKTSFDGIWFREHDIRMPHPRFIDGVNPYPGYSYGANSITEAGGNTATDGDMDFCLGLLIAYKQWGENSGYTWPDGTVISYKEEALKVIRGLVEKQNQGFGDCRSVSGVIGFDGYYKGGDTWNEMTGWATGQCPYGPEFMGPQTQHIDYVSSGYFKSFYKFLEEDGGNDAHDIDWHIPQLKRAEASTTWINSKLLDNPTALPVAGWNSVLADNTVTFSSFNEGEDFRHAWRQGMAYMWHGDPDITWDPVTHQVTAGGNSWDKDVSLRMANFLSDPSQAPWGNDCFALGDFGMTYNGPSQIVQQYEPNTGAAIGAFPLNWMKGTGAAPVVVNGDFELMGKMFREAVLEWDGSNGNLDSSPVYFHGFFRLLGMLILGGNHPSPTEMVLESNMKVYEAVNKTYAFTGDLITYTFSYRNYASIDAENVVLTSQIPNGLEFVSASDGGTFNSGSVAWGLGTVPGFKTATGVSPTEGGVTLTLRVASGFSGQICNTATIATSNGQGWTSNAYPNNDTEVMERNCVDIIEKAMEVGKYANYTTVNDGTDVTYKIGFGNTSKGGYLDGGRSGVNVSYAHKGTTPVSNESNVMVRLFHGASEPYINYGNYRISMFLNDNSNKCVVDGGACANGWKFDNTIYEGGDKTGVNIFTEDITPGSNAQGNWNQRVVIEFADQLAAPTPFVSRYYNTKFIREGGQQPFRAVWRMYTSNYGDTDWSDDWSWNANGQDSEGGKFHPIGPDYTDINNPGIPVTTWHNESCQDATTILDNILVEEWDGYTWRRVLGNGPLPGRDIDNVIVKDVLPAGLTFKGFVDAKGKDLGVTADYFGQTASYDAGTRTITWSTPRLQVGQIDTIRYVATANFTSGSCPRADEVLTNTASIEGDNESPEYASVDVTVTCDEVILPPVATTMTKTADKASYQTGEQITYTIEYEQTHGAALDVDLGAASDWTEDIGNWNFGSVLSTGTSNNPSLVTHTKAHGLNGTITGTLEIASNATFTLAFRHQGGTYANGSYISFKPNPGAGSMEVQVWNGTNSISTQSIGSPPTQMDFKIELNGDQLNLWVSSLTGSPSLTATGITEQAGYIGFMNGSPSGQDTYASHSVISLDTELDTGFDIEFSDPIPAGISFASADNSGVDNAGTVEWPIISTPTPYGSVITRSWVANVDACPTENLANTAYVNMLGQPTNSIAAQVIVTCGSTPPLCTAPPTVVLSPSGSQNVGNSDLPQTIAITSDVTGYDIEWSDDNGALPAFDGLSSIDVTNGGNYTATVFDASDPVTCTDDASVEIIVCPDTLTFELDGNPITDLDIVLCPGETKTITLDNLIGATNYKYDVRKGPLDSSPLVDGQSGVTHSFTVTDADVGSYFVSTVEESTSLLFPTCGFINPTKLNIIAAAVPTGSFVINGDTDVCEDSSYTYEITGGVGATDYEWTLPTGVTLTSDTSGLDSYQITVTIGAGASGQLISALPVTACTQAASAASTTLNLRNDCVPPPTCTLPLPVTIATTNDTLCKNSTTVDLSVVLESGYAYSWYEVSTGTPLIQNTAETVDDNSLLAVATGGDYAVWVHKVGFGTDLSCLVGDTITIIEEDVPSGVLNLTGVATVCPNEMGVVYSVDIDSDASDYRWEVPAGASISDTTGKNSNSVLVDYGVLAGDVKVTSFNKCGDGVSDLITVSVSNKPAEPVVTGAANEDTLCVGQTANLVADVLSVWYVDGVQLDSNVTIFNHTMLSNPDVIIEVAAIGSCGISDFVSIELRSINIPSVGSIVGAMEACKISPEGYSATGFTDAEKYEWTINNLAVFNPVTDSTNAVTVDFNAVTTNEVNISVRAKNKFCGYGLQVDSTINIVTNLTPAVSIVQMDTVCSGSDQLFKAVVESGGDSPMFVWNSGVPTVSDEFTLVGALGGETITLEMTSNSPCVTGSPVVNAIPKTVVIDELPVTAIINETGPISNCLDTTSLSANAAVGGYWTQLPLTVKLDSVANHVDVTKYLPNSITTITWNIPSQYGKCVDSTASIDINKLDKPSEPTISTISGDDKICMGEAVQVVGSTVAPIIEWSGDVGLTNTSFSTALFTPTSSGSYDLKLKVFSSVEKGCADSAIVSVEVFDLDKTVAISSLKTEECEGVAVNFTAITANDDYDYIWTPVPTSSNTLNSSSVDYEFGIAGAESISVSVDVSSACPDLIGSKVIATDDISFTVNGKPDVVLGTVITGNDEPCSGIATYTYSIPMITNADSYSWTYPNGWAIQGVADQNTIDLMSSSLSESGIIEVTASNSCGDLIVADLSVLIDDSSPKINAIDFDDREYCEGEEVLFTANVDKPSDVTDYIWYVDGNKESSSTSSYPDKIKEGETVSLAIRFASCDGTPGHDSTFTVINVLVPEEPTITAQVDDKPVTPSIVEVCTEQSVLLQANGSGSMLWSTPNGNVEGDVITLKDVKMSDLGTYSVQSFQGACGYYPLNGVALDLEVNRLPYLNFVKEGVLIEETKPAYYVYFENEKQVISLQGANLLDATISFEGSAFATDLVNKSDNSAEFTTNAELGEFWEYIATATNQFNGNCVAKDTVSLSVVAELNPTSAFTPNGDNINDTWKIAGMEKYPSAQVQIFNRWGHLVFKRIGLYNDEPWTGERNNKVMPTGTYYYVIELNHPDYPKPITGTITILE